MKEIKQDIEKILIEHKENEGKRLEIELKLEEYQQRLDYAGTVYEDNEKEVIENMQTAGQAYDTLNARTNKKTDKVYNTAINYKKELNYINTQNRVFLNREIERLIIERDIIDKKIVRVKNWLDKLESRERTILEEFYINNKGKNWDKALIEYNKKENKELSRRQLISIRDKAIGKILKMVNV